MNTVRQDLVDWGEGIVGHPTAKSNQREWMKMLSDDAAETTPRAVRSPQHDLGLLFQEDNPVHLSWQSFQQSPQMNYHHNN